MDKFEKIVMLVEHGFTKEEIDRMFPAEPDAEPSAPAEPEPAAEPAAPAEPAAEPAEPAAPDAVPEAMTDFMADIKKGLQELTAAVQANNIKTMSTNSNTAEDMNKLLAEYINPPKYNKE